MWKYVFRIGRHIAPPSLPLQPLWCTPFPILGAPPPCRVWHVRSVGVCTAGLTMSLRCAAAEPLRL